MLEILHTALKELPGMVKTTQWRSMDVLYETPRVQRLWIPYKNDYRLYLHKIYPCDKALFHPHPWPSAVHILSGSYRMQVGYTRGSRPPKVASTVVLRANSEYEMVDPHGWHSVSPIEYPSFSAMVSGRPFEDRHLLKMDTRANRPLSDEAYTELITRFDQLCAVYL